MLFILKQNDSGKTLPPDLFNQFLKSCEVYIEKLKSSGKLISAQPIEHNGKIVSVQNEEFTEKQLIKKEDLIGGYYHIYAEDIDEAISIAKSNPEFKFNPDTKIEVRPVKGSEKTTGYVYPKSNE